MRRMSDYQPLREERAFLQKKSKRVLPALVVAIGAIIGLASLTVYKFSYTGDKKDICTECGIYGPLKPAFTNSLDEIMYDSEYKRGVIDKLAGAIQIPTEIFDDTPKPSPDLAVWKNFQNLHIYLEEQFPLLYKTLDVENAGGYGLLYTWKGSNSSLKPLVLMAHQDVVPVDPNTVGSWTHPPFSGFYNDTEDLIYGRGTADIKDMVISHLEASEKLIKDGFKPKRTILISLGCDEEASGACATDLAKHIEKRYGRDSIYAILDEGGGVVERNGSFFAVPVTAEKGYLDAEITLFAPGGHSSVPPDHTSIGILSKLMASLENDTYQILVNETNPAFDTLKCFTKFGAIQDKNIEKHLIEGSIEKLEATLDYKPEFKYLFKTSQALDVISGGVKANALPESATVLVNNRIALHSSVNETLEHILLHVRDTANRFDLGIKVLSGRDATEDNSVSLKPDTVNGRIVIKLLDPLEPAPISPTIGSEVWNIIAGTTVSMYKEKAFGGKEANVYVTPALSTGNTDTKSYWNLTKKIYRYSGGLLIDGTNEHTVDEKNSGRSLISSVAFMYQYISNVDFYSTES
ncbi:LANO_0F01530g1_1 [Lachancea nothofagi CBS 11611]|uniref:LANO_0F01530g1_1 n=1 Tax=Lachancea nothofagi CBS 11611 TaxID=1266666 RepID=A0A1G4K652_9SACH|nr:LANO_0F01530g1_1 [Lachancea nothofagi CBS 11611]